MTTGPVDAGGWHPAGPVHRADDWRARAACLQLHPDFMFKARNAGEALHVCLTHCPVLAECAAFAAALTPPLTDCVMGGIVWRRYHDPGTAPLPKDPAERCPLCPAGGLGDAA